jgi:hypothetical protein
MDRGVAEKRLLIKPRKTGHPFRKQQAVHDE